MSITAIRNHIIFKFIDDIDNKGQFVEKKQGSIFIPGHHSDSASRPRWATVVSVGPDVKSPTLKSASCDILIENLRWTPGVEVEGQKVWRTDEDQILAIRAAE